MSTRTFAGVLLTVGLLCAAGLAAGQATQDSNQPGTAQQGRSTTAPGRTMPSQMPPAGQALTLVRAHELIGKEVKNTQGEDLGRIHDLVLTPDDQHVSYVALSSGGVMGVGSKLYAIPWQALKVEADGRVTTSITKDQLKTAPEFTHHNWPSQADTHWLSSSAAGQTAAESTTGRSTATESTTTPSATSPSATSQPAAGNMAVQARRVTHLTGMEVKNPEGQDIGNIEDFSINTPDGRIIYDIISFGGVAGVGERYAAVPPASVRIQPQTHTALLNATRQALDAVAFKPSEPPDLASREYMQRIYSTFRPAPGGTALGYVPPAPSAGADPNRAWGAEGSFSRAFNPSNVKTITGTIQSVGMFLPENAPAGTTGGLRLRVKTADGNFITVFAGPIWYAEQKHFYLMPGDQVSITGAETKIRSRTVIVASQIAKGSEMLQLRDQSGKPLWHAGGPGTTGMAPEQAPAGPAGQTRPSGTPRGQTRP
jgi:sporulation protein YlmC with PRC-barrel domain